MSYTDIYNLEAVVEGAVKNLMTAQNVTCLTQQDQETATDFQKLRPRVEVEYINGAGQGRWKNIVRNDGTKEVRESAWKGTVKLDLITEAAIDVHQAFRVLIRSIMHGLPGSVNDISPMTNHKIQPYHTDGGTSPKWTPQEGSYQTQMSFDINVSIQDNAWASLES